MQAWMWWFVTAVGLLGVEMLTVDLFFLMAAGGAIAAGTGALTGISVVAQFVVFAVVSVVLIGVVRPVAIKHFRQPVTNTNVDALVGAEAFVLEQVDERDGRVKLGGEVWSARSSTPTAVHAPGAKVHVVKIDGATAIVS